jgi:hypothetical protein
VRLLRDRTICVVEYERQRGGGIEEANYPARRINGEEVECGIGREMGIGLVYHVWVKKDMDKEEAPTSSTKVEFQRLGHGYQGKLQE